MNISPVLRAKENFFFGEIATDDYRAGYKSLMPGSIFSYRTGEILVKSVENDEEALAVIRLREETARCVSFEGPETHGGHEEIPDNLYRNLIAVEEKSGNIIASCRITSSEKPGLFPSEKFFDISRLKKNDGIKIEVDEFCFSRPNRRFDMTALLLRSLITYGESSDIRFIFFRSSLKTDDLLQVAMMHRYFSLRHAAPETAKVHPRMNRRVKHLDRYIMEIKKSLDFSNPDVVEKRLPSPIRTCLSAGAYVGGEPALNSDGRRAEFLFILDFQKHLPHTIS